MAHYVGHSLAPSTQATYRSGWDSYCRFCTGHALPTLPPTDRVLSAFVSHLADRLVTHGTIQVYLSAIAFHSQLLSGHLVVTSMPLLHCVLRGIRRVQGSRLLRPPREPITPRHMLHLREHIVRCFCRHDALMLWAAFTSAFFGLLRSSEYCSPSPTTLSPSTLLRFHLSFTTDRSSAHLFLPMSKTDRFARGANIPFFTLQSPLCPVSALWHFARTRHISHSLPLFTLADGSFLTRDLTANVLRAAFPYQPNVNTHSFRIGGASALATAGVPDYVIQVIGRWSSDSFLRYIRTPQDSLRSFQHLMLGPSPP